MNLIEVMDYIDADVAYLLGLITGRGRISESGGIRQITIEFPYQSLQVEGTSGSYNADTSIRLGLQLIQERLLELTGADITITPKESSVALILRFIRNTMVWRNILMHVEDRLGYEHFLVPQIFFSPDIPKDWKREYIRGFADVAGNIRHANRYISGAHRVRLDVLNYQTNWEMPCPTLYDTGGTFNNTCPVNHLGTSEYGRDFREHQINIFAVPFGEIGFSLSHKQSILEEFIEHDQKHHPTQDYSPCLGRKKLGKLKKKDKRESDEKLDERLQGKHFNAYWQICKKLGCPRRPSAIQGELWEFDEHEALEEVIEDDEANKV